MQAELGDQVEFLGVAGEATRSESATFVERFGVDAFPQAFDESGDLRADLGGRSRSTFLFIDDDGTTTLTQYGQVDAEALRRLTQELIDS